MQTYIMLSILAITATAFPQYNPVIPYEDNNNGVNLFKLFGFLNHLAPFTNDGSGRKQIVIVTLAKPQDEENMQDTLSDSGRSLDMLQPPNLKPQDEVVKSESPEASFATNKFIKSLLPPTLECDDCDCNESSENKKSQEQNILPTKALSTDDSSKPLAKHSTEATGIENTFKSLINLMKTLQKLKEGLTMLSDLFKNQ